MWWIPIILNAVAQKSDNRTAQAVAQVVSAATGAKAATNTGNANSGQKLSGASIPTLQQPAQNKTFGII